MGKQIFNGNLNGCKIKIVNRGKVDTKQTESNVTEQREKKSDGFVSGKRDKGIWTKSFLGGLGQGAAKVVIGIVMVIVTLPLTTLNQIGDDDSGNEDPYTFIMPDLTNCTYKSAQNQLKKGIPRLKLQKKKVFSILDQKGKIIKQSIPGGEEINRDDLVSIILTIGKGHEDIPDLRGEKLSTAKIKLRDDNLNFRIKKIFSSNIKKNYIIKQKIIDKKESKNIVIKLFVSKGMAPVKSTPRPTLISVPESADKRRKPARTKAPIHVESDPPPDIYPED